MKISKLVKRLQELKKEYGDVNVIADDFFDESGWEIDDDIGTVKTVEGPIVVLGLYKSGEDDE